MGITHAFNEAAEGGGGEEQTAHSPEVHGPGGAGDASAETASEEAAETEASQEAERAQLSAAFNRAGPEPKDPAPLAQAEEKTMTEADARAELETLEAGRPEPEPREELRPPTKVVRVVNSAVEREREARISALKAYMEYAEEGPDFGLDQEFGNDLELAF